MSLSSHALVRRAAAGLAAVGLAAGLGLVAPAAADAAPSVTVSCASSGPMHFSPGVQLFPLPQHISYMGQNGMCTDTSGTGITRATLRAGWQGVILSCELGGLGTGSGTGTIEWTTEYGYTVQSTVDLRFDHNVGPLVAISGTITNGPFTGHAFSGSFTTNLFGGSGKCTIGAPFGGVTEADFNGQFTVS